MIKTVVINEILMTNVNRKKGRLRTSKEINNCLKVKSIYARKIAIIKAFLEEIYLQIYIYAC